jgi:hypothetical protein
VIQGDAIELTAKSKLGVPMALAWQRVDSIVFETTKLNEIRGFYEQVLELEIARYINAGVEVEDVTELHVNYRIGQVLVGFELGERTDTGKLVLRVSNLSYARGVLSDRTTISKSRDFFVLICDPDGRHIIAEQEP